MSDEAYFEQLEREKAEKHKKDMFELLVQID